MIQIIYLKLNFKCYLLTFLSLKFILNLIIIYIKTKKSQIIDKQFKNKKNQKKEIIIIINLKLLIKVKFFK